MLITLILAVAVLSLVLAAWLDRQIHNQIVRLREREALRSYARNN